MSHEPMELAKNWDEKHASKVLPGYAQIKYDGVPLTFKRLATDTLLQIVGDKPHVPMTLFKGGTVVALTRQNEAAVSVPHLLLIADLILLSPNASYTAECFVVGKPFKDSSGIIRRTTPDEDTAKIIGVVFDYNVMALPRETYYIRKQQFEEVYEAVKTQYGIAGKPFGLHNVMSIKVSNIGDVNAALAYFTSKIKNLEGMMIHSMTKPFQPGKRCWGMSRVKPQPTIDLEVVSFEEATSEAGEPLGMVGRVNVRLIRQWPGGAAPDGWEAHAIGHTTNEWSKIVGVGPGKLTHDERKDLWELYGAGDVTFHKLYAEIKYMPDESYEALRQPTIQRLRTDKTEGDVLEYV